jgi:hypothetical protein
VLAVVVVALALVALAVKGLQWSERDRPPVPPDLRRADDAEPPDADEVADRIVGRITELGPPYN